MHDPDPQDSNSRATGRRPAQGAERGTDPAATRSAPGRASNELSGTAGTFVAALFAVALLAILFIRLSDHLQSHLGAGAVIGAGFALWLLLAAFVRLPAGGVTRLLGLLGAAIVVAGVAFLMHAYLGWEGLKWSLIVVAGFYVLKLAFDLLERSAASIFVKIVIWIGLGAGALLLFYQVGT